MSLLLVVGGGGHGRVVAEAALESGRCSEVRYFDDRYPELEMVDGFQVVGRVRDLWSGSWSSANVAVAIGDNRKRVMFISMALKSGYDCPPVVHPSASVSRTASLAEGVAVLAGAIVSVGASLSMGCIANTGCTIDHDCALEQGVHVSPGANLAGGVSVGEYSWVGIGATVNECLTIGANAVVGASASVIRDVPDCARVVGVPAKAIVTE